MVFREKGSTPIKHTLGTVIINSHLMHTSRFDMICSVDTNIYYSERRTLSHGISGVPNCVHVWWCAGMFRKNSINHVG